MNPEIAVIVPDKDLFALVNEISAEITEPLIIKEGYLDEGLDIGYELEEQGVKVLISRGGTARKLQNSDIQLPVIDIPITEYDIIRVLDQARKISKKIAVVGFEPLVKGAQVVGPILGLDIKTFLVNSYEDINEIINDISNMGIKVIVGAKLSIELAKEYGITGVLIKSQKPLVIGAIKEAIKLLNAIKKERVWGKKIKTIFNSIPEGIVSIDQEGLITNYNTIAENIFNISTNLDKANKIIKSMGVIEAMQERDQWLGEVKDIQKSRYVCNLSIIEENDEILGATLVLKELKEHEKIEYKVRSALYQKGLIAKYKFDSIICCDDKMKSVIERAKKYALADSTILVEGESGTGKEVLAQSIHNYSLRKDGPFVAINCAVLPENLLESELFGYVEGAFTGAKKGGKLGLFEIAQNGTLFLDEIGEIPLSFQARLLRVLEEKVIRRIGDDKIIPTNVRIICATNRNLAEMVKRGEFRSDLFYRVNILKLSIPSLHERQKDIPVLISHFIKQYRNKSNSYFILGEDVINILCNYKFPGNIRELKNIVERIAVSAQGKIFSKEQLEELVELSDIFSSDELCIITEKSLIKEEERKLILKTLADCNGNKSLCARTLGISTVTLWRKLKEYN